MKGRGWIVALLLGAGLPAAVPAVEIDVQVEPRTVRVGEGVRVQIEVSGPEASRTEIGSPPKGRRLVPAGGVRTSQSFSWINGKSSASKTFTIEYLAIEQGEGRIPSFTLQIGDEARKTAAVPIKILPQSADDPSAPDSEISITPRLDRKKVYVGQTVTLDYVLRTRVKVQGFDPDRLEPIAGFIIDDEKIDPNATARVSQDRRGRQWTEYVLFRRHLTPTRTGEVEIPAVPFAFGVPRRNRDRLGFFFEQRIDRVARVAPALKLHVRPLPEKDRPTDFTGGVGHYRLEAEVSPGRVRAGEAFNVVARITGDGPLGAMAAPLLDLPQDVQGFEPLEEEIPTGGRRFVFPLVARAPGTIRLDGVHFSYFDPDAETYRSLASGPLEIEVLPAASHGAEAGTGAPLPVRPQGSDLRFLHPTPRALRSRATGLWDAAAAWIAALAPPLGLGLLALAQALTRRIALSPAGRRRRWRRRIDGHLARARKAASGEEAAKELILALHTLIDHLAGARLSALDPPRLRRRLAEACGDRELAARIVSLVDRAEAVRYGGGSADTALIDAVAAVVREATR
ncbi:MAG: BatD family protein [Acidobacteriota bacterium]|nr:BatD family protein [Acidobacteriota bacterium]MDQ7088183.1 BatD family protein [Acidobacteriota bacterium]